MGRILFGVLLGSALAFAAYWAASAVLDPPASRQAAVRAAAPLETARKVPVVPRSSDEIALSFAPVVEKAGPAVVNVYATKRVASRAPFRGDPFFRRFFEGPFAMPRERVESSLGSGVIVREDGLVVTNAHVIGEADEVRIALSDGREYDADIMLRDERTDLAVLSIDADGSFATLPLGDSDELAVGDLVLAIGNPFGVGQTVTNGIVSALARTGVGIGDLSVFIQTDAAINPGNSGGALVDLQGQLVGVNTAIFSRSGGSNGIGFAIPSDLVSAVVAQAEAGAGNVVRPYVGAAFQEVTPDIADSIGLDRPRGALVVRVFEGSPAAMSGLEVGDVVLAVDGRSIGGPAALNYRLALARLGDVSQLDVQRRGRTRVVELELRAPPTLEEIGAVTIRGRSPLSGATVADLSPALAGTLPDLPETDAGVAIVSVEKGTPAERLGLRTGDVIVSLDERLARSAEELAERALERRSRRLLVIDRGGRISRLVVRG